MSTKKSTTEELFLKLFKGVILMVMALTLIATAGALAFAAYQYTRSPQPIEAAKKAPVKSVEIDAFLKTLDTPAPVKEAPTTDGALPVPAKEPEPVKYQAEASKIMGCFQESDKLSGIALAETTPSAGEDFRRQLQEVSDLKSKDRGQPFVTDAAKLTCDLMLNARVIEHRKKNPQTEIFFPVLNFHMNAWDELKLAAQEFEANEQARFNEQMNAEQRRVELSKESAKFTLAIAGGAFALFMAIALSLIVAAIESNLRRISVSLEALNEGQSREQQASASEASIDPAWPDLNVTLQPAAPTPQA
jgi:hypothetical protein